MLRIAALFVVSIGTLGVAVAQETKQDAKPETVEVHGKALTLSCAEWKRNQDGTWTNISPLQVGTEVVTSVTLRGATATKSLEGKCGVAARPSDTPPPRRDAARHMKHMRHPAGSAEGAEAPAN